MNENIENVLAVLDEFRTNDEMSYSAYSTLHDEISLLDDLLKEQELTAKFSKNYMNYVCSNCGVHINDEIDYMMDKPIQYCPSCGRKVKMDS